MRKLLLVLLVFPCLNLLNATPITKYLETFIVEYSYIYVEEAFGQSPNALFSQTKERPSFNPTRNNTDYTKGDNIFFEDSENQLLFIDFEPIRDKVLHIELKRKSRTVYKENLLHLSSNSIYELDLEQFKKGKYYLVLTTSSQTIEKEIKIK